LSYAGAGIVIGALNATAIFPNSSIGLFMPGAVSAAALLIGGTVLAVEYFSHRRATLLGGAAK
jgi:hypothetical protein